MPEKTHSLQKALSAPASAPHRRFVSRHCSQQKFPMEIHAIQNFISTRAQKPNSNSIALWLKTLDQLWAGKPKVPEQFFEGGFKKMHNYHSLTETRKNMEARVIRDLIDRALTIAKEFRQKETELIAVLQELDASKAYRATGYNSLFQFCVESLELTEHQAYQYITVSRKCTEVPELMVALEDRRITVSKARKLSSVIDPINQKDWIDLAYTQSQKDLESAVRKQCPLPPVRDHLQILSANEVKLQATLDSDTAKMMERVMELVSEKLPRGEGNSINQSLNAMAREYLKKHDPVLKAQKALGRAKKQRLGENRFQKQTFNSLNKPRRTGTRATDSSSSKSYHSQRPKADRSPLPSSIKHHVMLRDQGRCRFYRNGQRCMSRKFLEVHHKTPVSEGGSDSPENLVLLCSEHHKTIHGRF